MSSREPLRYRPPPYRDPCRNPSCADAAEMAVRIRALEADLRQSEAQVRSLTAEVQRLQRFVPRAVLKGEKRPTRREKIAASSRLNGVEMHG